MPGGRPIGRIDNPYNKRQKRSETEEQKEARLQKAADTKRKNKAAKSAAFFEPRTHAATKKNDSTNNASNNDSNNADIINDKVSIDAQTDAQTAIDNDAINIEPAADVFANLDIDEDEPVDADDDEQYFESGGDMGVQQQYIKAIQLRLRDELGTRNNPCTDPYTLTHLKENGWWIKKENAPYFVKKLGLKRSYDAYYRDVYVWLPDVRWGKVCMPCCPSCKSNEHVGNNGFHDKHFGRLIIGLKDNYYTISRRYICYACQAQSKGVETAVEQVFGDNAGVSVETLVNKRPLFDKGFKPESLSNMLLEMHTVEFGIRSLRHEYEIKERRLQRRLANTHDKMWHAG
jgi:hypothetical protein